MSVPLSEGRRCEDVEEDPDGDADDEVLQLFEGRTLTLPVPADDVVDELAVSAASRLSTC